MKLEATPLLPVHTAPIYHCWHRDTYVKEEPGESPNDRNDRAIRVAAQWCVCYVTVPCAMHVRLASMAHTSLAPIHLSKP
jgi:hypothetical protein